MIKVCEKRDTVLQASGKDRSWIRDLLNTQMLWGEAWKRCCPLLAGSYSVE
jgi:hypothetical protein